jgi:light-harvesting protein B-800-850 alpha chain
MNQGRIWCVVHPTVGLPLLLGSVALTSLAVHAEVLSHTTWFTSYWQGAARAKTAEVSTQPSVATVSPTGQPAFVLSIAPVAGTPGKTETSFVVTVSPNPAAGTTLAADDAAHPAATAVTVAAADLK